jgi:hypothetical protein
MKFIIVGGGIAGLAAAHRATELARERGLAVELTLLEARERVGGTIATERIDGFLVESGPDSFLSEKPWALGLCRRLGLEDRLVGTDGRFRRTFVWRRGRLHPLPDGFQLRPDAAHAVLTRDSSRGRKASRESISSCPGAGEGGERRSAPSSAGGSVTRPSSASPSRWWRGSTRPIPTTSAWGRPCRAFSSSSVGSAA